MNDLSLQRTTLCGQEAVYAYSTVSADRLPELQREVDELDEERRLAIHPSFREQVADARFALPSGFPKARSIIALALATPLQMAQFRLGDRTVPAFFDKGYLTIPSAEDLRRMVQQEIVRSAKHRAEAMPHAHLKLLAVRSGLGRYGRNNLCYVEGMGSLHRLFAFVTDRELPADVRSESRSMARCEACRACTRGCPTGAIRGEEFLIDADRCLSLHNEYGGELPDWIPTDEHHALFGCVRCQLACPVNLAVERRLDELPPVTDAETQAILSDRPDEALLRSAGATLRIDLMDPETRATAARNLRAVVGALAIDLSP